LYILKYKRQIICKYPINHTDPDVMFNHLNLIE
jgi:hypothetical protein